jgi:hypothetical protein
VPGAHFLLNSGGANGAKEELDYKIVSSTQSSVTATYGSSQTSWETIGDAIDAPAAAPGIPGSLMMLGVGQ